MRNRRTLCVLLCLCFGVTARSALSQSVVLSGTGDRWFAGDLVSEGNVIAPDAGETVRIVVGDAITSVVAPERHVVKASDRGGDIRALASALTAARTLAEERRWLRDGAAFSLPPSLWSINIALGGTYCFVASEQLQLWRPVADTEIELQISDLGDQWDVFVELRAGEGSLPWPTLPTGASGAFVFSTDPATQAIVETEQIRGETALDAMLSFAAEGCEYQLFLLTTGLPLETANDG